MTVTRHHLAIAATVGSLALLAGAFVFQFLGWAPCQLCLWQRWPHAAAIAIGLGAITIGTRAMAGLGALAMATAAGLAAYHTGVERKWWDGPSSCSGAGPLSTDNGDTLLPGSAAETPALVMCDQLQPFFMGLTMANWNLVFSTALMALWIFAALRRD